MKRLYAIILAAVALASCSTTKVLTEGECRLVENKVVVVGEGPQASELQAYIKQKPNDYFIGKWNPFLYVYNWTSGKGTGWDRFVEKLGVAPVVFNQNLIPGSKKGILSHMEYLGYYGSEVETSVRTKGRKAEVTYTVTPGHRFLIDSLSYETQDSTLRRMVQRDSVTSGIRLGTYLSQKTLEEESERMASMFRNLGYYGFTKNYFFFTADTTAQDGTVDLSVQLKDYTRNESPAAAKPHVRYHFDNVNVNVLGRTKIKQNLLEEINRIKTGMLYREVMVDNTYNRFSSLSLFNSVNIQLHEKDSAMVDCDINLIPAKTQGIKLNLEASTNSTGLFGVTPSVSYSHKNLFGGGELLSLGFRGNFQFKFNEPTKSDEYAVNATLRFPRFVLLPSSLFHASVPQTEVSLLFNYQDRPEYTRNIVSLSYGYNWSAKRRFMYQVYPLKLNSVYIFNITPDFYESLRDPYLINAYQNHFDFGSGANFYYTTDPSVNPKRTYFYTRLNVDVAGNVLALMDGILPENSLGAHKLFGLPYAQYVRGEATAVQTIRFGAENRCAIALRALAGAGFAYGNSQTLPFEKFFYAGGANSLRGWQARSVGPGGAPMDETFSIANQAGDMHLEANAELRFPLFWKLDGSLFADAGNIWNVPSNANRIEAAVFHFRDFYKTVALDWGMGVRLDVGMLLIRVDMGIKAYDPVEQEWRIPSTWLQKGGYALHFGIGYPF